jgi:hypothetical protein
MSYKLKIDPVARMEMLESTIWCTKQQSGLGRRYFNSVKQVLNTIKRNPYMFQICYKTY